MFNLAPCEHYAVCDALYTLKFLLAEHAVFHVWMWCCSSDVSLYFSPVIQRVLPASDHRWRGKKTLGKNAHSFGVIRVFVSPKEPNRGRAHVFSGFYALENGVCCHVCIHLDRCEIQTSGEKKKARLQVSYLPFPAVHQYRKGACILIIYLHTSLSPYSAGGETMRLELPRKVFPIHSSRNWERKTGTEHRHKTWNTFSFFGLLKHSVAFISLLCTWSSERYYTLFYYATTSLPSFPCCSCWCRRRRRGLHFAFLLPRSTFQRVLHRSTGGNYRSPQPSAVRLIYQVWYAERDQRQVSLVGFIPSPDIVITTSLCVEEQMCSTSARLRLVQPVLLRNALVRWMLMSRLLIAWLTASMSLTVQLHVCDGESCPAKMWVTTAQAMSLYYHPVILISLTSIKGPCFLFLSSQTALWINDCCRWRAWRPCWSELARLLNLVIMQIYFLKQGET